MSKKDSLGDRMKSYEHAVDYVLTPRTPLILRVDGKAFHTYTKGLKRPWDETLNEVMDITAATLCDNIQGAQVAYVQSDEISILVHGYKSFGSQQYFNGRVQKMCSVTASIAAATFTAWSWKIFDRGEGWTPNKAALIRPAYFDCRAFVLPEADVCNYFLWRQQDATRNSIQSLARSMYSHKECNNKNGSQLQEMCFQKGQNWNDLPVKHKRGRCIVRKVYEHKSGTLRAKWEPDENIPIFTENRDYINRFLALDEE